MASEAPYRVTVVFYVEAEHSTDAREIINDILDGGLGTAPATFMVASIRRLRKGTKT